MAKPLNGIFIGTVTQYRDAIYVHCIIVAPLLAYNGSKGGRGTGESRAIACQVTSELETMVSSRVIHEQL